MSSSVEGIKKWISDHDLDAIWNGDRTFVLGRKDFLCIEPKKGKLFDEEFNLILDQEDIDHILIHNYCFMFGGKVFWTPVLEDVQLNPLKYLGDIKEQLSVPNIGIHGGYELCNGSRTYEEWVGKAKWLKCEALGICERNTLAGVLKFQKTCLANKIKPIIGETVVVRQNDKSTYQIKLFVINSDGWDSLLAINKIVNVDSDDRTVSEPAIFNKFKGLAVVLNEVELTDEIVVGFMDNYDHVYYQIDPCKFNSIDRDKKKLEVYKQYLKNYLDIIPPILIGDSYYLDKDDFFIKKILNQIGNVGYDYQSNQYFKSLDELMKDSYELFSNYSEVDILFDNSLSNLLSLVEMVDFVIPTSGFKLPEYKMTEIESLNNSSNLDLIMGMIEEGVSYKKIIDKENLDDYLDRIQREIDVIQRGGFIDYFLILADIVRWCKEQGILTGLGRGSAAGSLVSYLLDITKVDPLEYDLLFERFLNEGRLDKSLPDIDFDVPGNKRGDIKRYIEERYGAHNVCSIGTYGTFKVKGALRDIGRIKGIPPQTMNYFAAMLNESGDKIIDLFKEGAASPQLKKFIDEHSDTVNIIDLVLNQPKNSSIHAAGVVITPIHGKFDSIYKWMPVKKVDGVLVSEWEGPELESTGFLKEDILGILQLDKFAYIFELIKSNGGTPPDFESIDYNDPKVLELFSKGYTQDSFHFGSPGLTAYSQDVQPDSIEELIAMISLYRPGAMEFGAHEDYVKIKFGKKEPEYDWGCEEITKKTYSLIIYQEQAMAICTVVGGFTLTDADSVRRGMGKKKLEEIAPYKDQFIKHAVGNDCPEHEAINIWNKIEAFAGYSFNRSHAAAYAMTGYFCQYLKYYFPMEFWTVALDYAKDDKNKNEIPKYISEITRSGDISILPPDINNSGIKFTSDFDEKKIYWSLSKIKFVGEKALDSILKEREENGSFFSLQEFLDRIDRRTCNKRVVINMILSGCFDKIEKVTYIEERKNIIKLFFTLNKEEMPEEYSSTSEFFWFNKQREISGSGNFDYRNFTYLNSQIPNAHNKYMDPDQILLIDSVDEEVVVCGIIVSCVERTSKKGEYAKLIIDNNNEEVEIMVWNETWVKYSDLMKEPENKIVIISGAVCGPNRYKKHNVIHSLPSSIIELV